MTVYPIDRLLEARLSGVLLSAAGQRELARVATKVAFVANHPFSTELLNSLQSLRLIHPNDLFGNEAQRTSPEWARGYLDQDRERFAAVLSSAANRVLSGKLYVLNSSVLIGWNTELRGKVQRHRPGKRFGYRKKDEIKGEPGRFAAAHRCQKLMENLLADIGDLANPPALIDSESKYDQAILLGLYAHLATVLVHPFFDGNGRTARLLEAIMHLGSGIPLCLIHRTSNWVNTNRAAYYQALSDVVHGASFERFFDLLVVGLGDEVDAVLGNIEAEQFRRAWLDAGMRFAISQFEDSVRPRALDLVWRLGESHVPDADASSQIDKSIIRAFEQHNLIRLEHEGWSADPLAAARLRSPRVMGSNTNTPKPE